jgi:hypothetical protein
VDEFSPTPKWQTAGIVSAWNLFLDPERQTSLDGLESLQRIVLFLLSNAEVNDFPLSLRSRLFIIEVPYLDEKTFSDIFDKKLQDSLRRI